MSMGLLDLPAPLYAWLDAGLAEVMPPLARILLWGALAGLASMGLYAALAPQARIARCKREAQQARRTLDAHDGELVEAMPVIGRLLKLSLRQVRLTTLPALLASLPLLTVLAWMSTVYGSAYPAPPAQAQVEVRPAPLHAQWYQPDAAGAAPGLVILDGRGQPVTRLTLAAPVGVIDQWHWWNALLGNPAGYLPRDSGIDSVRVELPRREYLSVGPGWARGWELAFFVAMVAASLGLKIGARIQ
jgi:hypothetical protein